MGNLSRGFLPTSQKVGRELAGPDIATQLNRRANLRACLAELLQAGTTSAEEQADFLGMRSGRAVKGMVGGDHIYDGAAREIEWAMQKRRGWLDEDHREDRLDQ